MPLRTATAHQRRCGAITCNTLSPGCAVARGAAGCQSMFSLWEAIYSAPAQAVEWFVRICRIGAANVDPEAR